MSNRISNNLEHIQSKDLNREKLYKLFIRNNTQSINIEDITETDTKAHSLLIEKEIRNSTEKLLFLNLLMDCDLESQIKQSKNAKYDYMTGLLLYITSNPHFKYGFGYFKDYIQSFDKILDQWCKFLDAIIADINALPIINLNQHITVEFGKVLNITLCKGIICEVKIDMNNFDSVFKEKNKPYDFCIKIDLEIFETGKSDGSGLQSDLYKAFSGLNKLIMTLSSKRQLESMLIPLTHGH